MKHYQLGLSLPVPVSPLTCLLQRPLVGVVSRDLTISSGPHLSKESVRSSPPLDPLGMGGGGPRGVPGADRARGVDMEMGGGLGSSSIVSLGEI